MTTPTTHNDMTMRDAALSYARMGSPIFPAHPIRDGVCACGGTKGCSPGKHPIGSLVPQGVRNASADHDLVAHWWAQVPDANIGRATGKVSGLVVLDVDGSVGEAFLAKMEKEHGSLPATLQVKTGKGRHLYFRYPENRTKIKSIARAKSGLDVRADGGYVIAPPSIHESGRRYLFELDVEELAECPEWVIAYANGRSKAGGPSGEGKKTEPASTPYSEAEEVKLRSALECISAHDRDTWRDVGAALHSLGWGEKAFTIWNDWSRSCLDKYDEADQQKTWDSFDRPYSGTRITVATIYWKAQQHGWVGDTQTDFHTDLGNARRLVKRHGENIRFIHEWQKWIMWDGDRWVPDEDGAIMRRAKETVEAIYPEALRLSNNEDRNRLLKHAIKSQAEARLKAMVSLAQSEPSVVLSASQLDGDPWLLGVQNGVIELKTGNFRPARREDLVTKQANVAFDPNAQCPNWSKFLDTITGTDRDLQSYHQRVAGYTLTGSTREEVLFVFFGTGNNGKSTHRETLHFLLGDYALAADAGLLIERKTPGGATPELARLKECRLVSINETSENDHLNEARVKFITSQDKITARNLYQGFFDFDPSHKTALTTNHKPIIRGTDIGIWRRIHLLPFTTTIPPDKVEKDFRERQLVPELPGILNWALAGLAAYLKQGLNPPKAVLASTEDYRQDMDVVGQWIDECCQRDPQATIPTSHAYRDYAQWAEDEVGWALKKLTFRRHLSDRGFTAEKGTHGQRMIRGLRLKPTNGPFMGTSVQLPPGSGGPSERPISIATTVARVEDGTPHDRPDPIEERLRALLGDEPTPASTTGGGGGGREAISAKFS
jgi:putative DNA primase/helicase